MAVPALSDWEDWSYRAGHGSGDHKPTAWQQPAPSPPVPLEQENPTEYDPSADSWLSNRYSADR